MIDTDGGAEMADEDELGPVDYLVVEFPGNKMTGEGFPILVDLVDRGIIRILDLMFVRKDARRLGDCFQIADFDGDGEPRSRGVRGGLVRPAGRRRHE